MLIGVLNFEPRFCPNCGRSKLKTAQSAIDWDTGASRECRKCGVLVQRAWTKDVIDAAEKLNADEAAPADADAAPSPEGPS